MAIEGTNSKTPHCFVASNQFAGGTKEEMRKKKIDQTLLFPSRMNSAFSSLFITPSLLQVIPSQISPPFFFSQESLHRVRNRLLSLKKTGTMILWRKIRKNVRMIVLLSPLITLLIILHVLLNFTWLVVFVEMMH